MDFLLLPWTKSRFFRKIWKALVLLSLKRCPAFISSFASDSSHVCPKFLRNLSPFLLQGFCFVLCLLFLPLKFSFPAFCWAGGLSSGSCPCTKALPDVHLRQASCSFSRNVLVVSLGHLPSRITLCPYCLPTYCLIFIKYFFIVLI